MDSMKQVLIKAILDLAAFLEFSDEDILDPDTAVKQMESLATTLEGLSQEGRSEFLRYLEELADDSQAKGGDREYVDFLMGFGDSFGLVEVETEVREDLRKYIQSEDGQGE